MCNQLWLPCKYCKIMYTHSKQQSRRCRMHDPNHDCLTVYCYYILYFCGMLPIYIISLCSRHIVNAQSNYNLIVMLPVRYITSRTCQKSRKNVIEKKKPKFSQERNQGLEVTGALLFAL